MRRRFCREGGRVDDYDLEAVVVRNDEEQYSWWPKGRPIPDGWHAVGKSGSKAECLAYIDEVWTDIRPLSMRRWADSDGR
jgi:MbtH protein